MYPEKLIGDYVTLYGICIAIGVLLCIFALRYFGKKIKVEARMGFVNMRLFYDEKEVDKIFMGLG